MQTLFVLIVPLSLLATTASAETLMQAALGADIHATNNQGDTPLSMARDKGHESVEKMLLDAGAKR